MTCHSISNQLLTAFEQTRYIVYTDTPFTLRIGNYSNALEKLHQAHGARCSAFITAYNPASVKLTIEQNKTRQRELKLELDSLAYTCFEGIGQPGDGNWEGEASYLVLNIPEPEADRLCEKYGQLAIVYCGEDAVPRLKFSPCCRA